jgi:ribosomal protein S18 acetylase RimI-like enzyme
MGDIHIREAQPEDADAMRDVQRRTWLATYPNKAYGITREDIEARFSLDPERAEERRERYRRLICTPPFHAWVALEETVVIGFCIAEGGEQESVVGALYILPEFQNRGAGKRLLQATLDWLGMERDVVLNVASYNEKAIAFYRAFGFEPVGPIAPSESLQLPSGAHLPEIKMVKKKLVN